MPVTSYKITTLADEYKQRQQQMDQRLKKEIENHSIAKVYKGYDTEKVSSKKPLMSKDEPLAPLQSNEQHTNLPFEEKPAQFFRSNRSIAMRINNQYENQVSTLETDKLSLIQKLNDALVQLDKLNQEKSLLSNMLIELIKFVRDMQRETNKCDDIDGMVSEDLRGDLKFEKERSHQLREELKRAEIEKMRILEKLSELGITGEDLEIRQTEIHVNLGSRSKTFQELQQDYRDIIAHIDSSQQERDHLQALCIQNKELILELQTKIEGVEGERVKAGERLSLIQDRYDAAIETFSMERHDMDMMHDKHIKLLSTNLLFENLQQVLHLNVKAAYDELLTTAQNRISRRKGLLRLRKLFKRNRARRLRKYIQMWFSNVLKPMDNKKQQFLSSFAYQQQKPKHYAYYTWRNTFQKAIKHKHVQREMLIQLISTRDAYHNKVQRHYLTRWRDLIRINQEVKKKVIKKILIKQERDYLSHYFAKWQALSLDLNHQIQLNNFALRAAHKNYLSTVFSSWKQIAVQMKNRRQATLVRVWKNMKIFVQLKKQQRCQALTVFREERLRNESLLKACFDELRTHKEQEKLILTTLTLYEVEIPRKEAAIAMINKVTQDDTIKYQTQAVNAIGKCFGKVLQKYFTRWRKHAEHKERVMNVDLKQRILTRYLGVLRYAFKQWIAYKGTVMLSYQSGIIADYESESQELTNEIVDQQHQIDEGRHKQQCQSARQLKKLVRSAFERHTREMFNRWRSNMEHRFILQSGADKIMTKLNRRQKKLVFDKYKAQIEMLRQEDLFEKRVEDIRFKLRERYKQRIFNTIRLFSNNHKSAKNYLRRLLVRLDLSLKQAAVKKWLKYRQHKHEKQLAGIQHSKVEQIQEQVTEINLLTDENEAINVNIKDLSKRLNANARRIIRNSFMRQFTMSQQYFFDEWKSKVEQLRKRDRVLRKTITHLLRLGLQAAFQKWSKSISYTQQHILMDCIQHEEKLISSIDNQQRKNHKYFSAESEDQTTHLDKVKHEQELLMIKHSNCLKAMVNRVDTQVHLDRRRHILQQWNMYIKNRKRLIMVSENAVKKTLWQEAFNEMRQHATESYRAKKQEQRYEGIVKAYYKIKMRRALEQWLRQCSKKVTLIKTSTEQETSQITKEHSKLRANAQKRIQSQLVEHRQYLTTFDCYIAWKNQMQSLKLMRTKVIQYQKWQQERQEKYAINKWVKRINVTRKFRMIKNKIDRVYDRKLALQVIQGWLYINTVQKRFCQSLGGLATIMDKVYLKRAIGTLKNQSSVQLVKFQQQKLKGSCFLFDTLENTYKLKMRHRFSDIQIHSYSKHKDFLKKLSVLKHWFSHKLRYYFTQWHAESQLREVVRYNNDEGPVAVEVHLLKQQMYNLKLSCIEEGIPYPKIEKQIVNNHRKSVRLIEKSVCRLFCASDEQYRLMPTCLDRWKQWVAHRKLFKYWLHYLNNRVDFRRADIAQAFQRWKQYGKEQQKELSQIQKSVLEKICIRNAERMNEMADEFQIGEQTVDELTEQRNLLLQRYVGSQKLALAVSNASCDRAKQKVLSRWVDRSSNSNTSMFEEALRENLMKIAGLKDRIRMVERSNEELADQNEELRQGAMDGIEMAKSVDDLTREREKLSIDMADKAITIRKLLEDNHNLSVRLNNAQDEAHNLIRLSQLKISQRYDDIY